VNPSGERVPETRDDRNERLRARFHDHFEHGVGFNASCGITIPRWDPDGVEFHLPYRDELSAHDGIFHGGVIAALIDTTGCGAVLAGHDFSLGSRISTVDLSVQFFAPASGDVVAFGQCTRRGRTMNFADVLVRTVAGKDVARGLVTALIAGERPGVAD
jgi:uncharacterized protein (TIGR00369 family)